MDKVPKKKTSVNFPRALFYHLDFLKLGVIGCPDISVRNYHSVLLNISLDRRPHMIW